jgi:hypothetical protein
VDSRAQKFMGSWISTIFFLSYYFFKFTSFFFPLQVAYTTWLHERYKYNPLTHLELDANLWLEVVDPIEIEFMIFQTLQLRIYRWTIMYWPWVPHNWLRALNLQSTRHFYENMFKLKRLGFLLRQNDLVLIRPHLGYCTWSCYQTWVVYVVHLAPHPVPVKICIHLLLLYHMSSRWIVFKLIIFKFLINIWFFLF